MHCRPIIRNYTIKFHDNTIVQTADTRNHVGWKVVTTLEEDTLSQPLVDLFSSETMGHVFRASQKTTI